MKAHVSTNSLTVLDKQSIASYAPNILKSDIYNYYYVEIAEPDFEVENAVISQQENNYISSKESLFDYLDNLFRNIVNGASSETKNEMRIEGRYGTYDGYGYDVYFSNEFMK